MSLLSLHTALGIDLGTANLLVYQPGKGLVVDEPAMVAVTRREGKLVAIGEEARQMLGRTPGHIVAVSPLHEGVIANYSVAVALLRHVIDRLCGRGRLAHPVVAINIPCGSTGVERRALLDAAHDAGARLVYPLLTPVAAALGAGLPVTSPQGSLLVDIGGGATDIAVIALGGMVTSGAVRVGGQHFRARIIRLLRSEYNLLIGDRTAEEMLWTIGSAAPLPEEDAMTVRGRDVLDGLPRTVEVRSPEVRAVLLDPLQTIADKVCQVLAATPPELAADISEHGMTLTGGGALLRRMDSFLAERTNVPAALAIAPLACVALGAGRYLESLHRQPAGGQRPAFAVMGG